MEKVKARRLMQFTFVFDPKVHAEKVSKLPSETVPNEALSIRDLVEHSQRGLSVPKAVVAGWDSGVGFDSLDLEKLKDFDVVDRQFVIDELASQLLDLDKQVREDIKKRQADKLEKQRKYQQVLDEVETAIRKREEQGETSVSPDKV